MKDQSKIMLHHLFRCIERCYAEEMVNDGCLFFRYPIEWIRQTEEEGIEGQGDRLEGVFMEDTPENRGKRDGYSCYMASSHIHIEDKKTP